jgi:putative ABC transport system substrate-binding protein
MPVIGFLGSEAPSSFKPLLAAFHQGLGDTDYVEGDNLRIEYRWAEGNYDRLPALAADLVSQKADVIAALGGTPAVLAAKSATSKIPIVFESGLVASLARPGRNLTGVSLLTTELMPKRLDLLSELVPQARVVALLVNPNNAITDRVIGDVEHAALDRKVQLAILKASTETELAAAFASLTQLQAGALVVVPDPFLDSRREALVALASRDAVPAMYGFRQFVTAGGLISYGPSYTVVARQLGILIGKILKGTQPTDLPVEQPTKFELVINLKTAKALGLTIPPAILARADEVIE